MTLPMPPQPGASPAETLLGQYAYLYQLAGQLNLALSTVENRQITVEMEASSKADSTALAKEVQSLRSLIVKSADTVRAEMDRLEAELKGSYVAASEFGSYVEQLSLYLEANPEAVTQYYKFAAELQGAVDRVDAGFTAWRAETGGYIRTGVVAREADGTPIYGVAVGQDLTVREVDGETEVEARRFRSTFTASRLSFWQDETEVAYISDNRLHIREAEIRSALTLGTWRLDAENGLAVLWTGA